MEISHWTGFVTVGFLCGIGFWLSESVLDVIEIAFKYLMG